MRWSLGCDAVGDPLSDDAALAGEAQAAAGVSARVYGFSVGGASVEQSGGTPG